MTRRPLFVVLALQLGVIPAVAQGDGPVQRWPTRESAPAPQGGDQGGSRARDREAQPRSAPAPRAEPQPSRPPDTQAQPRGDRNDRSRERDAPATLARPRDDNDRVSGGNTDGQARDRDEGRYTGRVAVPRGSVAPRRPDTNVYIVRPPSYRYTPRFNRPYVYGTLGPGYFYYGSYGWYPRATYFYDRGYFGRGYGYDVGEVRLRVEPRFAEVYVDGFFAGTVDDFDGVFQSLKLESGPYHIEIVAPGFETLEVDLRVSPGRKITYRAEMRREF